MIVKNLSHGNKYAYYLDEMKLQWMKVLSWLIQYQMEYDEERWKIMSCWTAPAWNLLKAKEKVKFRIKSSLQIFWQKFLNNITDKVIPLLIYTSGVTKHYSFSNILNNFKLCFWVFEPYTSLYKCMCIVSICLWMYVNRHTDTVKPVHESRKIL